MKNYALKKVNNIIRIFLEKKNVAKKYRNSTGNFEPQKSTSMASV